VQVFAFVDTNVLLHYQFFADVEWVKQLGAGAVTLVFAPVVLTELDEKKWTGSRREKGRAKAVLKKLDQLGLSAAPVAVRPGVAALALAAEPVDAVFAQHRLDPHINDDRLLASVLSFEGAAPGDRVFVLTGDSGLRVKGRARQIEVAVPDESLELPDEPDDVERDLQKAQRDLAELRNAAPELKLCFGDGQIHARFSARLVRDLEPATVRRLLAAWRKRHPHISALPDSFELPGQGTFRMPSFAGMPGFVSAEDAKAHNAELDAVYASYEEYLREWPAVVNGHARIVPFNLVLENTGTAPADDIDVQFWTDAAGAWLDEIPKLPFPPAPPKRRDPFDPLGSLAFLHNADYLRDINMVHPGANEDGPNISGEGREQRVQYGIKRVKHHVPCTLPPVYFQFASDDAVGSFTVDVRIVAANIRKPAQRTLEIQLTLEEPVPAPEPADLLFPQPEDDE
jgi:hypothetical protein